MNYMLSECFVLIALTFKKIFNITHPFTKFLQGKDIDLLGAINYNQSILSQIQIIREDESFENILKDKENFINSKLNDFSFTYLQPSRVKKIKKMPGEIAADEQLNSPIDNFRIKTYYSIIDIVTTQITERFNEDSTPLFKDLSLFQVKRLNEVAENAFSLPIDAFDGLANVYGKFLNASDLRREFVQFANSYSSFENIMHLPESLHEHGFNSIDTFLETDTETDDECKAEKSKKTINDQKTINSIFKVCHSTGLKEVFPGIYIALRIALTLPVSSASPERAFSKLKLIKTRLRSTMCEERLESLMLISCEKDIAINTDDVIKTFSSYSSVLRKLLL